MKKIIISFYILLSSISLTLAEGTAVLTVSPADVDALTENVTLTFDVSGTDMEGQTEAYLWSWSDAAGDMRLVTNIKGGGWGDLSTENAKLDPIEGEPNKFQLKLPKTVTYDGVERTFKNFADLFDVSANPAKVKKIGFLIRSADGNHQTDGDFATSLELKPLVFEEKEFRTFPSSVSVNDVITVYLKKSMVSDPMVKIMDNITVSIDLTDDEGNVIITNADPITPSIARENEYAVTFIAEKLGAIADGKSLTDITEMKVKYSGVLYNADESTLVVESETYTQAFKMYN